MMTILTDDDLSGNIQHQTIVITDKVIENTVIQITIIGNNKSIFVFRNISYFSMILENNCDFFLKQSYLCL